MRFDSVGDYLVVSRITGPHHNMLQLRLAHSQQGAVERQAMVQPPASATRALDAEQVVAAVLDGVASANDRLGTRLAVTHIRFVADDSKPESIYRMLAEALVEHFVASSKA